MAMGDGHSGINNQQIDEGGSDSFRLILAYLKQGSGQGDFVIHATSASYGIGGLNPADFLAAIGFTRYPGRCPFHNDTCFYREIATLQRDADGFEHMGQVQGIHDGFQAFAVKIGELFQLYQQQDRILRAIGLRTVTKSLFGSPMEIEVSEDEVPLWVQEVKFPRLLELEQQRAALQGEIDELSRFLPLLYSTGPRLEVAVIHALRFLGLEAGPTAKGFTADILAQTPDGARKFGFEVTGTSGPIKKDSNKLTQVLDFERVKEHDEKTVLIANTHNTTPIARRKALDDFTPPVLSFLGRHPILLMTGWDLYRMVGDVLAGSKEHNELIDLLYTKEGKLEYADNWL